MITEETGRISYAMVKLAMQMTNSYDPIKATHILHEIWEKIVGNKGANYPISDADMKLLYEATLRRCLEILSTTESPFTTN